MPFTQTWDEAAPAGSAVASGIDTYIQTDKIATRERLESIFGIADFSTRFPMSADAFKMSGAADSYIVGGTASWGVKDNANANYNIQITNAGVLTVRAGLTITAGITSTKQLDVNHQGRLVEYNAGNSGAALTINWNNGNNQKVTLTASCTFTLTNPIAGCWYQLRLVQDVVGSRTAAWPANTRWQSGVAPTLTATASRTDIISLFYDGVNYLGVVSGLNWSA